MRHPAPASLRELLALAVPLIISQSVMTVQLSLDRILLTWNGNESVAAAMPAVMLFATVLGLFGQTVHYASVFVSQYLGAGRPHEIGPVVWQAMWVALASGAVVLLLSPLSGAIFHLTGHAPEVAEKEAEYFRLLCYAAPASLITTVVGAYFAGQGRTWLVLLLSATGVAVNAPLAYAWVVGAWGFPVLGITGAGYATIAGSTASAALGLLLLIFNPQWREHRLRKGLRLDVPLLRRLLYFGIPNGLIHLVDTAAWTAFVFLVGSMSKLESAATNIAFTINLVAFLPLNGLGQGVEILVGKRQGEERPDLSERTTWLGLRVGLLYAGAVSALYIALPGVFLWAFKYGADANQWAELEPIIRTLLVFVGVYTLADTCNIVLSFALRGAGDTKYVALMAVGLAWPCMVIPTYFAVQFGWGVYGAWVCATVYIAVLATGFVLRFRGGRWRTMKVIEPRIDEREPAL